MKHILPRFMSTVEGKFFFAVGLIIVILLGYYSIAAPQSEGGDIKEISVTENDHVRGALDGKVTLVEFGDFQCPACGAYEPIVRQVMKDNPTSLKVVFKHFPLTQIHRNALQAAIATEAAGLQGKFWEMHDIIYDKQEEWSGSLTAGDFFLTYATTLGLDTQKFKTDSKNQSLEDKVLAEFKEGVSLGVQGTPTFFLNGVKLSNPIDLATFNKYIKEAEQKASQSSSQQ